MAILRTIAASPLVLLSVLAAPVVPFEPAAAVDVLNAVFTGHAQERMVYMRQTDDWYLYCGDGCYNGYSDCRLGATFSNWQLGVNLISGGGVPMQGVIFNSTLVETKLARCYYATDGSTESRFNGGCGCLANDHDFSCSNPRSPYNVHEAGDSPLNEKCRCKSNAPYTGTCFWRGPAFNTSHGLWGKSELQSAIQDRLDLASWHEADINDEAVLDAGLVREVLKTDPASAIVAVFYYDDAQSPEDTPGHVAGAKRIQRQLMEHFGVMLPIVGAKQHVVVSSEQGPFFVPAPSDLDSAVPGAGHATVVV